MRTSALGAIPLGTCAKRLVASWLAFGTLAPWAERTVAAPFSRAFTLSAGASRPGPKRLVAAPACLGTAAKPRSITARPISAAASATTEAAFASTVFAFAARTAVRFVAHFSAMPCFARRISKTRHSNERNRVSRMSSMNEALIEARLAAERDETPVGAVLVFEDRIIARAGNETRALNDPTAHAEILAIRRACALLGQERLIGADLYVTLEPCAMCATAISFARIRRLYFGAGDPKGGAVEHGPRFYAQPTCHHAPDVYSGIGEQASADLLRDFFRNRR